MSLAWDTAADRTAAERSLAAAFRHGLGARRIGGRSGVRLWSSRGGVIAMSGAGRRTAIVLAPDSRTAARVLAAAGARVKQGRTAAPTEPAARKAGTASAKKS
jgi:hypothetical protein